MFGTSARIPEAVAPPRFLPDFDNALLSHDDRSRIIAKEHRRLVGRPTLLLDGYAVGSWKLTRDKGAVSLVIEMLKPLSKGDLKAVEVEGLQLLDFTAAGATTKEIRFVG
ncbi:MAG TPA: crosslink repair DNA glycosylase YcaQ family protein [Candidatus Dormibacteraeota bacterium]